MRRPFRSAFEDATPREIEHASHQAGVVSAHALAARRPR
jgi:hypothetical protein